MNKRLTITTGQGLRNMFFSYFFRANGAARFKQSDIRERVKVVSNALVILYRFRKFSRTKICKWRSVTIRTNPGVSVQT